MAEHVSPIGASPVVTGRVGLPAENEAGVSYFGRALRVDVRHAFSRNSWALSLGAGGSAIVARRPDEAGQSVLGGGLDLPLLAGWTSRSDLYSVWFGPRFHGALLQGRVLPPPELRAPAGATTGAEIGEDGLSAMRATDLGTGLLFGVRAGFRHVHVAIELEADYRHIAGSLGGIDRSFHQISLTPAGALSLTF